MNALLLSLAFAAPAAPPAPTPPEGVRPVGTAGKPLNLDFEDGTLTHWTATGDAFKDQPVKGDTVAARRPGEKSGHQGEFWVGGFEKHGDAPTGTLTSDPFRVTHPWASFLVGGGNHPTETCVELLDGETVFSRVTGDDSETLKRVAVDLAKVAGKEIRVRLVDKKSGGWGHVNFDDFRFHAEKPTFPVRAATTADEYKFAGQTPLDAAKNMTVPPGFAVRLFAGEPDLHQPVAMCTDDRGRLWVIEAYCYPQRKPFDGPILPEKVRAGGDKILIFEDTDGDGTFDKKTVFLEGLNLASGIELGFGGVWIGAAPYLMFVPVDESGDKPAGEPKILLDGWGWQDTHETLNSFVWGPDGWLYGCHGVFTHSRVGKPGTPQADRTPINAGVWRYHPTRHVFEVFAHGTSNPWGLDYNANGDFFVEACVIPHLWHIVPGGRYQRQAGQHFNPYTFDDIPTIAKHRHYVGGSAHGGNGKSDSAGGGHAHSGLICYQGGAWPKEYHGKLFMGNIHGHRINVDEIKPKGSSYEGDRNPDFLLSHDKTCIIVALHAAPDGNVYFTDWSDKQVCHSGVPAVWDRTNGRVFKIVHESTKPVKNLNLAKLSDAELVKLQTGDNEWMARHARRILQERKPAAAEVRAELTKIFEGDAVERNRLRALWALHAIGSTPSVPADRSPTARAWGLLLAADAGVLADDSLVRAAGDESPVVRRAVANLATRLPAAKLPALLPKLFGHADDAADPVLRHLDWYALEPLAAASPVAGLKIAAEAKLPGILDKAARRVGAIGTPAAADALVAALADAKSADHRLAYLRGLQEFVKGKRLVDAPKQWAEVAKTLASGDHAEARQLAAALAVKFGDPAAIASLRTTLAASAADPAARQSALAALVEIRDKDLPPVLHALLGEPALRAAAVRALASFDDPKTPAAVLAAYPAFTAAEKRDAVATLASRPAYARDLLAAVADKKLPPADIPAEAVRQLRNLGDESVNKRIATVWGLVRETPAERKKLIAGWTAKLTPAALAIADPEAGRAVFSAVCAQCHTLYGVGGKVGPEITGANRGDLGYLLENIFDPSAVIPKEYAAVKFDLADGRVVTGIVKEETAAALTVVTANETLTIPANDIDKRTTSDLSMMPDDLTKTLSEPQLRDLIAYLKLPRQVPVLATADNAKDFFNGKDLTGWDGDKTVWSVENGEIVGKTATGLKRNDFLKSGMSVTDFRLSVRVKLTPNEANSGIQFRSVPLDGGEMRGPQADIGKGWWGKLYEESGRGLLVKDGGETFVKPNDWNDYVVEAVGPAVKIWINGEKVADYTDEKLARRGLIGFQVHSGGPTEVRFKDLRLTVLRK